MKYAQMRHYDISNGPGIRATLFVSGCTHNCEDCFNKEYQNFNFGKDWDSATEAIFLKYAESPYVAGISILGGEPLQQIMDNDLANLLRKIKRNTNKPIWLWTGYIYEDIANNDKAMSILENVDVLIDGKFEKDKKNISLKYRGSSNQRIIDLKTTRLMNKVVLLKEDRV